MKRYKSKTIKIFIVAIAIFFITASLVVGALGAIIYDTTSSGNSAVQLSMASDYLTDIVRHSEDKTNLRIASLNGSIPAFVISSNNDKSSTEKWIYAYEGSLRSCKAEKGSKVLPEKGKKLFKIKTADFQLLNDDLLEINLIGPDNEGHTLLLNISESGCISHD